MTQSKNSPDLASTKLSDDLLKKSRTIGVMKNMVLAGIEKLKSEAYPKRPAPITMPYLGIGRLWLKVLS
ncbi:MAG: hypothetical protein PHY80_05915 [Rickettsiales bacterium]|nr:hypothetical protein [Rickettsiales bacterium]